MKKKVYEAEPSLDGESLTATKTKFRNSVVDNFYEEIGHDPYTKHDNNFEYKYGKLYFIKDGQEIRLSSEKDRGKFVSLSTLKTRYGVEFIRFDINITDDIISKEARAVLAKPASYIIEISFKNIPMKDLPKAATDV